MTTEVLYARVPADLKEAVDAYASEQQIKLTAAVVDLLGRGLAAASDEQSVEELQANLARITTEKAAAEAELITARAQLAAIGTFADRAAQRIGTCPNCKNPITGSDLYVASRCPACQQPLTELLAPQQGAASTLDQRELLLLAGALGAVLALAYLTRKK